MRYKFQLVRTSHNSVQVLGHLVLIDTAYSTGLMARAMTLEPKWANNKPFVSCIPDTAGNFIYYVALYDSPKHGECFLLSLVPDRTDIEIHAGNFFDDTTGCILVGNSYKDIDGDGNMDVVDSKTTLETMIEVFKSTGQSCIPIEVISVDGVMRFVR